MFFGKVISNDCFRGCKDANELYPPEFFNFDFEFHFDNFTLNESNQFLGSGHFSTVYKATFPNGTEVAIKNLLQFNKRMLGKEFNTLRALNDVPNVLKIYGIIENETNPAIVYSYHSSTPSGYNGNITLDDFRWWLKTTLETLANIHEHGVIHRDLRLANILADFEHRKLAIVDFGLSDFYRKGRPLNPRVGCVHIKAPELVANISTYGCAIDIWSLGLSCLDIMIRLKGHWDQKGEKNTIEAFIKAYGSHAWNKFAGKYNPSIGTTRKVEGSFYELGMPGNNHLLTPETMDLVSKMLELDPENRVTAREALKHKFFQT